MPKAPKRQKNAKILLVDLIGGRLEIKFILRLKLAALHATSKQELRYVNTVCHFQGHFCTCRHISKLRPEWESILRQFSAISFSTQHTIDRKQSKAKDDFMHLGVATVVLM